MTLSRRTVWVLTRPQPEPTGFRLLKLAAKQWTDPRTCDHLRVVFNGDVWFCHSCGEPVKDKDERRQSDVEGFSTW